MEGRGEGEEGSGEEGMERKDGQVKKIMGIDIGPGGIIHSE